MNYTWDLPCTGTLTIPALDSCWETDSAYLYNLASTKYGQCDLVQETPELGVVLAVSCLLSILEYESMVTLSSACWYAKMSAIHGSGRTV